MARGYSIDSRTVQPGELFFAVKGERLDGHDFVAAGARTRARSARSCAKISWRAIPAKTRLLAVDDTLTALQTLATAVRRLWGKTVVGDDRFGREDHHQRSHRARALGTATACMKSKGNFNNHFGLPADASEAASPSTTWP